MACCPYACCTTAAPLLLMLPSLIARFRAASRETKIACMTAIPIFAAALVYVLFPDWSQEKVACVTR